MSKILIVLPCYNEQKILKENALKILDYCKNNIYDDFQIIIANNASTDKTLVIAKELSQKYPEIKHFKLDQKGKGIAIKKSWEKYSADYYVFMDVDLSTDLKALSYLINILKQNKADLVIGSRYAEGAELKRSFARSIISKIYNLIIKIFFNCPVQDMAIGFKGANKKIIESILPLIQNNKWFFDSELVLLAHIKGYKIKEIPVIWHELDQRKSRVNVIKITFEYLKELIKLKIRLSKQQCLKKENLKNK